MGVSDRLYETACECRDLETSMDRVLRDLQAQRERADGAERALGACVRAAEELLESLDGGDLPAGARERAEALRRLTS